MAKNIYRGFSTYNRKSNFKLNDFQLVRQDLCNHFQIRKGEKLMNPDFGTIIWNMIFEPLSTENKKVIIEDVRRIVSYDPRLAVRNVILTEFDRGIQVEVDLVYVSTNQSSVLKLQFDKESMTLTQRSR